MTNRTKSLFISSVITAVVAISATGYFFYLIQGKAATLDQQVKIVTENNAKESTFIRLKKIAQETEVERAQLSSHFFKHEGDSISFLGEMESLAAASNLALKTEALDKVAGKDGDEYIKVLFSYEGSKTSVMNFSKLMEVLPYHSKVESLRLEEFGQGSWRGQVTVLITIDKI